MLANPGCSHLVRHLPSQQILEFLHMHPGDVVLELGCNQDPFSVEMARWIQHKGKVITLHSQLAAIQDIKTMISENRIDNLYPLLIDSMVSLPIKKNTVDWIFLIGIFHRIYHSGKLASIMKEFRRIHKPDGKLVIIDFEHVKHSPGPPLAMRIPSGHMNSIVYPQGYFLFDAMPLSKFLYLFYYKRQPQVMPIYEAHLGN